MTTQTDRFSYDAAGAEIRVGDYVAFSTYNRGALQFGKVDRISKSGKTVDVSHVDGSVNLVANHLKLATNVVRFNSVKACGDQ